MIFLTNEFLNNRNILRLSVLLYFIFSLILSLFLITTHSLYEKSLENNINWMKENDCFIFVSLFYLISYLADFKSIKTTFFYIFNPAR